MVGAEGRATTRAVAERLAADQDELAVGTWLRDRGLDPPTAAAAVDVATAGLRLPAGLAARGDLVFTRAALEQASDPSVSAWRARRLAGRDVVDLACGAGADLLAISDQARRVVGVDRDEARAVLAAHNVAAAGVDAPVVVGDALRPPTVGDTVHVDPGRRAGGRRARRLRDYAPPVGSVVQVWAHASVALVVSPAVAWDDPDLPVDGELEFTQRGADLTEAVVWTGDLREPGVLATATLLADGADPTVLHRRGAVEELPTGPVGSHLLEVAPAAVRARLHDQLGAEVGARRVARVRALLTTDDAPPASPWWRAWEVEAQLAPRPRTVRAWLRGADELPLELATSGADADPDRWWRDLGRPPRGPQGRRLLLVRLDERVVALALRPRRASGGADGNVTRGR